jgi:hypothetical protein
MANHGHHFGPWSKPIQPQLGQVVNTKNVPKIKLNKLMKSFYLKTAYGAK